MGNVFVPETRKNTYFSRNRNQIDKRSTPLPPTIESDVVPYVCYTICVTLRRPFRLAPPFLFLHPFQNSPSDSPSPSRSYLSLAGRVLHRCRQTLFQRQLLLAEHRLVRRRYYASGTLHGASGGQLSRYIFVLHLARSGSEIR